MAKDTNPGNRSSQVAKAGKRHGSITYPLSASNEKLEARMKGEQQFVANKQLSAEREGTIIVFDQKTQTFVYKTKKISISTEYVYDANRGRVVYSPSYKGKDK